jgi:hypothetical protein
LKRRSAASSKSPDLVFFVDRSLGKHKVSQALRGAGALVEIHDDHFAPDAKDLEWLPAVGARGWVVLTKDDRIRYREHEREALLASGVRAFVLTNRSLSGDEMAAIFVDSLPKMRRITQRQRGAFIAAVTWTSIRVVVEGS